MGVEGSGRGGAGEGTARTPSRVIALPDTAAGRLPVVPGWETVAELGRSRHAVVLQVRRADADYALKLLAADGDPQATVALLRREAARLAMVAHPGLPLVREVGVLGDRPYLVSDLVPGRPLTDLIAEGVLDARLARGLAADLAAALHAMHRAGLVHRHLAPSNVIVGPDGAARLLDVGHAARGGADGAGSGLPSAGALPPDLDLCGRDAELAALGDRWRAARHGRGGAALITGAAGIGKSRLVRELVPGAVAAGAHVLHLACGDRRRPWEIDERSPAAIADGLVAAARGAGGLLLHLDDVHLLDGDTRHLLAALAPRLADAPLLLVATSQTRAGAFRAALAERLELEIALSPLDGKGMADLLGTVLPGPGGRASTPAAGAARLVELLLRRSGGRPGEAIACLESLVDAGRLRPGLAGWELDLPAEAAP